MNTEMINLSTLKTTASTKIEEMGCFLVDIKVSSSNDIKIVIDSANGISMNDCVNLTKFIEQKLDRDKEDFSLSISSPGTDASFMVPEQFFKNYNCLVDVLMKSGNEYNAVLKELSTEKEKIFLKSNNNIELVLNLSEIKRIKKSKNQKIIKCR
tara:strand:- start:236 stop:697 length:462 start_codon:yes stop_codon:yes gene_type:complete